MAAAAAPSLSQESLVKRVGSSEMEFLVRGCVREGPPSPNKTRSLCVWLCLDKRSIHLPQQAEETIVEIEARFQHPALRLICVRM